MLEFVNRLLNSQDNIIDQLKLLKENQNHKEVKKYIKALVRENNSQYFNYCIDKYYFDKDVEEVEVPVHPLQPIYRLKGYTKIEKLLESKDNIIDQIKLLKEHKGTKLVDTYIEEYLIHANKYEEYCINKYYYDMDVEKVEPNAKNLNIKLYKIYIPSLLKKQENEKLKKYKNIIKRSKEGDKVKILDGPFKDLTGVIKSFDIDSLKINLIIELYGQKYDIEHDGKFEIIKEDNSEK